MQSLNKPGSFEITEKIKQAHGSISLFTKGIWYTKLWHSSKKNSIIMESEE